mgnify:CR=1 FL=1
MFVVPNKIRPELKHDYFLWPEGKPIKALMHAPKFVSPSIVEGILAEMFPDGYPVLCSSGRTAILLALIMSNVSRSDFVGVFPFASHCVLDAVSRAGTPLSGPGALTCNIRLLYHQWGFVQETDQPENTIEDSVDTLCMPGEKLFPGGGRFEIWSLPKILGTTSGGVLWCKDREIANEARDLLLQRSGALMQWGIRLLGRLFPIAHWYWQGAESSIGKPSRFQMGEILTAIQKWDRMVEDRREKLDCVWGNAPSWLSKPSGRLPPVVPVQINLSDADVKRFRFRAGYRHFERVSSTGQRELLKVLPIPIHQDVPLAWLAYIQQGMVSSI